MEQSSQAAVLDAVIGRISATMEVIGIVDADVGPWFFTRCLLRVLRFESCGRDFLDLDRAFADFRMLPEDFPSRAKLAATLVTVHLGRAEWTDRAGFARASALAKIADGDPVPLPGWLPTYAVVRSHSLVIAGLDGARGFRPREALAEVEWYSLLFGDVQPYGRIIEMSRLALGFLAATLANDVLAVDRLVAQVAQFRDQQDPHSPVRDRLDVVALTGRIFPAMIRGDVEAVRESFAAAGRMVDPLPPDDPVRVQFERLRSAAEPFATTPSSGALPGVGDPVYQDGLGTCAGDGDTAGQAAEDE